MPVPRAQRVPWPTGAAGVTAWASEHPHPLRAVPFLQGTQTPGGGLDRSPQALGHSIEVTLLSAAVRGQDPSLPGETV